MDWLSIEFDVEQSWWNRNLHAPRITLNTAMAIVGLMEGLSTDRIDDRDTKA